MERGFTEEDHERYFWMVAECNETEIDPRTGRPIFSEEDYTILHTRYLERRREFETQFIEECKRACWQWTEIMNRVAATREGSRPFYIEIGPHGYGRLGSSWFGACFVDFRRGCILSPSNPLDLNATHSLEELCDYLDKYEEQVVRRRWSPFAKTPIMFGDVVLPDHDQWPWTMYRMLYGPKNHAIVRIYSHDVDRPEVCFWDRNNDGHLHKTFPQY